MEEIEPRKELLNHYITLYGGEPLLKENKEIVKYIVFEGQKRGYVFHAVTNGYDLDYYIDLLGKNLICQLQITIDGTKEYHNRTRRHYQDPNSFDKIIFNIQKILDANIDVQINIRVNTDNCNISDFSKLKEFFTKKGFFRHSNFRMYSAIIVDSNIILNQDKKELGILSTKDFIQKQKERGNIAFCNGYSAIYRKISNAILDKKAISLTSTFCAAQTSGYLFSPLGEIYPCWDVVGNKDYQIGQIQSDYIHWDKLRLEAWRHHDIVHRRVNIVNMHCSVGEDVWLKRITTAFIFRKYLKKQ